MKKTRNVEEQIAFALKQDDTGTPDRGHPANARLWRSKAF